MEKRGLEVFIIILIAIVGFLMIMAVLNAPVLKPTGFAINIPSCSDHTDNDGDGYCDATTKEGFCSDGSKLGDIKCKNKNSYEAIDCKPNNKPEICDGIDNNCNGIIDENVYDDKQCGSDIGECIPGMQIRKCYEGQWGEWSTCEDSVDPMPEICDGIDNNCNGIIDENCIVLNGKFGKTSGFGGKPTTSQSTKASCADSDSGSNYNLNGHVYGITTNRTNYDIYDSCNGNVLTEMYCYNIGKTGRMYSSQQYTCPYGCANGTCNPIPNCSDGTFYDSCSTSKPLYCKNGSLIENCVKCGCSLSTQSCSDINGSCATIIITSNVSINGTAGNDIFSIHKGYLWINGVLVYQITQGESATLNGLGGDDVFISVGGGTQIINGGDGVDTYWVDSSDIINDASTSENSLTTVHIISQYYQPWSSDITNPDYIKIDSNGESIKDPVAGSSYTNYKTTKLFSANGIFYYDIQQGGLGDCYYMAALGTGANAMPELVKQAIVEIGDGNYIVRMYSGGKPIYLKLDADLPCCPAYAKIHNGLWVALLEKAFAHVRRGMNSYSSLQSGMMHEGYMTVFNKAYNMQSPSSMSDSALYTTFSNSLINKKLSSAGSTSCSLVVNSHAYMNINATDNISLYIHNPWYGTPGTEKLNISQYKSCFTMIEISQ